MSKVSQLPILQREPNRQFCEETARFLQEHAKAINEVPLIPRAVVSTTTHTFREADLNYLVDFTSGSAVTATVPTDAEVPFAIGSVIHFCQGGAGQVTIVGSGGTVNIRTRPGAKSAGQYAMCSIWKRAVNEWVVFGDVTT